MWVLTDLTDSWFSQVLTELLPLVNKAHMMGTVNNFVLDFCTPTICYMENKIMPEMIQSPRQVKWCFENHPVHLWVVLIFTNMNPSKSENELLLFLFVLVNISVLNYSPSVSNLFSL